MSEQQRLFLAVSLSMAIWLGWQAWMGPPIEPPPPPVSPVVSATGSPDAGAGPADPLALAQSDRVPGPQSQRSFRTDFLRGSVGDGDAGLQQLDLLAYQEGKEAVVSLVDPSADVLPSRAQARVAWRLPAGAYVPMHFVGDDETLELAGTSPDGLQLSVRLLPQAHTYAIDYELLVDNPTSSSRAFGVDLILSLPGPAPAGGISFMSPPGADALSAVVQQGRSLERRDLAAVAAGPWLAPVGPTWLALDRQYFVTAIVPRETASGHARVASQPAAETSPAALSVAWRSDSIDLPAGGHWQQRLTVYAGPKRDADLQAVAPALLQVVDYDLLRVPLGALARPMMAMLNFFHSRTGSWGVAIILLTLVVKLVLVPLNYRSAMSMRKMQLLRPELESLKSRFDGDKERQNLEQMKLFKERGVNPLGGCLPMLLQLPVGIALYRALWSAVDLYRQPFLWLPDLTAKEPLPLMALSLGLLTLLQQRLTPMPADNPQAKTMLYIMPVVMTFFMIALPSGLVLYILVNSVLTIIQQLAINRRAVAL